MMMGDGKWWLEGLEKWQGEWSIKAAALILSFHTLAIAEDQIVGNAQPEPSGKPFSILMIIVSWNVNRGEE